MAWYGDVVVAVTGLFLIAGEALQCQVEQIGWVDDWVHRWLGDYLVITVSHEVQ